MSDDVLAAGMLLRRPTAEGDRWLLLRASSHGEWGFPKGHADPGEALARTARRECAEECGIALLAVEAAPIGVRYRLPDGRMKRVEHFPAVTHQARVALSAEHGEHRWADADEVVALLPHAQLRELFTTWQRSLR